MSEYGKIVIGDSDGTMITILQVTEDQIAAWAATLANTVATPDVSQLLRLLDREFVAALVECPECVGRSRSIYSAVMHLNDKHKWPREHIADWLETLPYDITVTNPSEDRA